MHSIFNDLELIINMEKYMCLWDTMPPEATNSEKGNFNTKIKVKVIDLGVIWKEMISWVCMLRGLEFHFPVARGKWKVRPG